MLTSPSQRTSARLDGIVYRRKGGGGRSADPQKYRKDAAVLEAALASEPTNARFAYYLAQSLRHAGELEKAAAAYERRAGMGGWGAVRHAGAVVEPGFCSARRLSVDYSSGSRSKYASCPTCALDRT